MKVAIVHYHLKPGGVTRVIENAVAALQQKSVETVVLGGVPYQGNALPQHDCIPELDYCTETDFTGDQLAEKLVEKAKKHLGDTPDIWHIHNHSLGKNVIFLAAIEKLLEKGQKMLLQMHDFAEDGRPGNYAVLQKSLTKTESLKSPYPLGANIRYGVINSRDASYLKKAGIPKEYLATLPNAVLPFGKVDKEQDPLPETSKRLLLYPTRGIRRKNMGEMLLLAALWDDGKTIVASTLPPNNPQWLPIHNQWKKLAKELKIPAMFGVGLRKGTHFEDWIARSECLITTSIQEGFGLAYLEPWLFKKPLTGRNLKEITEDFEGIKLNHLYTRIPIPLKWLPNDFEEKLKTSLETYYNRYNKSLPENAVERFHRAVCDTETIDFGALDEKDQTHVIKKLVESPKLKSEINLDLNIPGSETITQNREKVEQNYALKSYGDLIYKEYRALLNQNETRQITRDIEPQKVLEQFLNPEHFRFLQS
jgi:hypothetical protein